MRILGISASQREWGNTDLLIHHVLNGAKHEGAESRFVRLTQLELRPCAGCMRCVFQDRDCVLNDRMPELLEALRWADGVVLGSPTYVLGATAAVKSLHDRLIRFGLKREFVGKPGVAIATAGVPGWAPFVLPQVSLTFLFLGMPVVDQFIGHAQGPGEIFDDGAACGRAVQSGAALGRCEPVYRGEPGACPVCHFDLVVPTLEGGAYCPLCDLNGSWTDRDGKPVLKPDRDAQSRWSEPRMRHHFAERILPSGPRFKERIGEIRARVEAFRRGANR